MSKTFGDEQEEEEDKQKIDGLSDDNLACKFLIVILDNMRNRSGGWPVAHCAVLTSTSLDQ